MAEQIQTDIFADFQVTEPSVIQNTPIKSIKEKKEEEEKDENIFSGFTSSDETKEIELDNKEIKTDDTFSGFTSPDTTDIKTDDTFSSFTSPDKLESVESINTIPLQTDEYTNYEKIRYGIDKQNTFFGNVFRVIKSGIQAAADEDRDFSEIIKYNDEKEKLLLKQKYGNLASGNYDNDALVKAAAIATFMADPFYIAAYMTPWGRAATASFKGLAALSGTTVGLDTIFDQLATTGKIDGKTVALTTGAASILGPLSVKAIQGIQKLLPGVNEKQLQRVLGIVEGRKAKQLGVSPTEYKKLQKIAGDKELLKLNNQLKIAGKNWITPIEEQTKIFNAVEKKSLKQIKKLQSNLAFAKRKNVKFTYKDKTIKNIQSKIDLKQSQLSEKTKVFNEAQSLLWNKASKGSKEVTDLIAKRQYTFLKKLKESQSLTQNVAQAVIASSIRPVLGGGIGYAFGKLWGPEDANLNTWMMTGAALGGANKLIQRSGKVFSTGERNWLEKIIYNEATKLSFQKVRELTSTTASTKLKAIGGETEKIGMKLYQELDSPFTKFSASAIADNLKQLYSNKAFQLVQNTTLAEQNAAVRIVRGSKEKASVKVNQLANKLKKYLTDFKGEYTSVGIGLRKPVGTKKKTKAITEIKDYFPRVWDWKKVNDNPDEFIKTLTQIFKTVGKKGQRKNPEKTAQNFYNNLKTYNEEGFYNKVAIQELITNFIGGKGSINPIIKALPLSEHIAKDRVLVGPYAKVEKILEQKGFLVNDIVPILNNLVSNSVNSIGFAKNFGTQGQLLKPYFQKIIEKYKGNPDQARLVTNELKLIMNSIDGFFGRYGKTRQGIVKSGAGILSTISNLNMLDRVTIASLGDLVQPFTNSNNFSSWIKGLQTSITAKGEKGIAKNLGYAQGTDVQTALLKTLTPLDNGTNPSLIMGASGTVRKINEAGFKVMGLQWLTGFARRYAYNTGAIDAYTSARKLAVYASRNNLTDNKALRLINDVSKYGISTDDALRLGTSKNFSSAIQKKFNKKLLNNAGLVASNRDALIPQVSNRLLFTQSRDPMVRLLGQFMSWTLAKSSQTNKLLQRIENGDSRQLVKLLAGLPVYGGIQSLREIAKYGEIQTDLETQTGKWFAESLRLSGIPGTASELAIGRLSGPGAREPWYLFAPFLSILTDTGNMVRKQFNGDTDKATQIFLERLAPLPTWRRWIMKLFPDSNFSTPLPENSFNRNIRKDFNTGDLVETAAMEDINLNQQEDMNIKDLASVAAAATIATTGVDADINKAVENKILPAEKPKIVKPIDVAQTKKEIKIFNNPGNIEEGQGYAGETGEVYAERFSVFDSKEMGIRALAKDLNTKIKRFDGDVEKIITQYAPPNENDTKAYIKFVKAQLNNKDKITKDDLSLLTKAVILQENKPEIAELYLLPEVFNKGMDLSTLDLPGTFTFEEAKKAFEEKQKTF